MTTTILIIVNVFAAIAIIGLTLMQQSKGDMGSAFGGGSSQSMFGSRGSANFLSRTTSIMCVVFFISSLALAYVYAQRADSNSVIGSDSVIEQTVDIVPIADDVIPSVPGVDNITPTESTDLSVPSIPPTSSDVIEAIEAEAGAVPAIPE